jgi:membrane-associated protein
MAHIRRRVGWADVACLGGLVAGWVYYLAIIPLMPSLIGTHPVLLEALNGSMPAQIAGGAFARVGRASLVLALLAPIIGMMAFDPFWWWAGRRYGDGIIRVMAARSSRTARGVDRGIRLFRRRGGWTLVFAYYLPVPNTILYAAAGWARFGLLRFIVLDFIGTTLYTTVGVGLGYALGHRATAVAGLISRYSIVVTVALIAGLILVAWWRGRRGRAAAELVAVAAAREPGGAGPPPVTVEAGQEPDTAADRRGPGAPPTALLADRYPDTAADRRGPGAPPTALLADRYPDTAADRRGPGAPPYRTAGRPVPGHRRDTGRNAPAPAGHRRHRAWPGLRGGHARRRGDRARVPLRQPAARAARAAGDRLGDQGLHRAPARRHAGNQRTGLGWHISSPAGRPVLWHNGATGGFTAMLAVDRQAGCAVGAVATSSPTPAHLLDGAVLAALGAVTGSAADVSAPQAAVPGS